MYYSKKKIVNLIKLLAYTNPLTNIDSIAPTPKIDSFIKVFITNSPSKMKNEALIISVIIHI